MRIGISVITHAGQSVWENGIGQNVIFLTRLLRSIPFVRDIVLLNCGDQPALPVQMHQVAPAVTMVAPRDATHLVDVVIEMAGGLEVQWLDYLRSLGKKVIFHCCGQPYVSLIEPAVFGTSGYFSRPARCDEIWILPKDREFAPMLRTLHRAPVWDVPYLWDGSFLSRRIEELAQMGFAFGYRPQSAEDAQFRGLRVAIFEPNISVVKSCTIPMLIADTAFRTNPDMVSELHVLNSLHMKEHPTFVHLANSLELSKNARVRYESRHDFAGYVTQNVDAIVSHQWHNSQNILYLDALYGGYPLIHNSAWLKDVGYSYRDFDVAEGAQRLMEASRHHDENLPHYCHRAQAFLSTLDPLRTENVQAYARRLLALTASRTCGGIYAP